MTSPVADNASGARRATWIAAAAMFCAGALPLAAPWLSGVWTIPWDAKAQAYPQIAFMARAFAAGDSPFWAPEVFAGHPQIADPQSLIFSPPFLLLAWLDPAPGFQAVDAVVFAMLSMAGLALMVFFRDRGWRPEGALTAAFAFAFGGSNAWRIQHIGEVLSLCWFVFALLFLSRALERRSWRDGLAAGVLAGFMVLGRDQIAYLCVWVLAGYVVWFLAGEAFVTRFRESLAPLGAGFAGGILVTAIPIAFTIALAAQSNRPSIDFAGAARGSLPPLSLLTAVAANLYGVDGPMADFWGPPSSLVWGDNDFVLARNMGAIYFGALPLVALFCSGGAPWRREIRFFTCAAILLLLYALGSFTPFFRLAFFLPGVDLFRRPADATFPLCALVAIIAGYCVHHMSRRVSPLWSSARFDTICGVALVALLFAGCVFVAHDRGRLGQAANSLRIAAALLVGGLAALLFARRLASRPLMALVAIGLLMTIDLAASNKPNESTALPPAVYDALSPGGANETIVLLKSRLAAADAPDRRDRVELAAVGYDWPNSGLVHGFDHDLGFNPVRLKLFSDATGAGDQIAIPEQRSFSPLYAGFRSPLADLLGVRYVLSPWPLERMDKSYEPDDLALVTHTKHAVVYENPRALPRVLFAGETRHADFTAMLRDGDWPNVDFTRTVLLENPDTPLRAPGAAKILSYRNTEVIVEAESPEGGHVVLNDVWHPWWRATIDGAPAPVLRANVMFRAVAVPAGKHRVTFRFAPFAGLWEDIRAGMGGRKG